MPAASPSPGEYSKGMAQKLGLVAAILPRTPLLVLDEPMSGLDPKARALVKRRLGELHAGGTTLFFSTHLLADVEVLCDRIALLHGGRIAFAGPPAELLVQYGCATLEDAFLAAIDTPASAPAG
jgi:ABC-2 type transport system ATP-binding protein